MAAWMVGVAVALYLCHRRYRQTSDISPATLRHYAQAECKVGWDGPRWRFASERQDARRAAK